MSFYPELDSLNLKQLLEKFLEAPALEEYSLTYYSEIAWLISNFGQEGIQELLKILEQTNDTQLISILSVLKHSNLQEEVLVSIYQKYLQLNYHPQVIAESIDGLRHLKNLDCLEQIISYKNHNSPYIRGAVLRFVAARKPDEAIPLLLEGLKDSHYLVRENAIDELSELGDQEIIPFLLPLKEDSHPHVREAVSSAISLLS